MATSSIDMHNGSHLIEVLLQVSVAAIIGGHKKQSALPYTLGLISIRNGDIFGNAKTKTNHLTT